MIRLFICSFGSVYDSNKQIITYTNTRLVTELVCAIVRYYLKESIYNTLMCKWGFMLNTYAAAHSWITLTRR